jgi:aminoglycoside phosphotransferase (APT) family kinase protein
MTEGQGHWSDNLFEDDDIFESAAEEGSLKAQILEFMRDQLSDEAGAQLESDPNPIAGGSSKLHYEFTASWFNGTKRIRRQLILRQEPVSGVVDSDMQTENVILNALRGSDVPVPILQWVDLQPMWFETRSMIFERSRGEADRAVLRDKDPLKLGERGRLDLARSIAGVLADLHGMEPSQYSLDLVLPYPDDAVMSEVNKWDYAIDREKLDPDRKLRPARNWIQNHMQTSPATLSLVHGDFRPANFLVDDGRITALLDWEMAHLGDAAEDLGWYTCNLYRTEHFLEGWTVDDFLARYVERGGTAPDPERLQFWQIFAELKLAVIGLRAARNVEEGRAEGPAPRVDRVIEQLNADLP